MGEERSSDGRNFEEARIGKVDRGVSLVTIRLHGRDLPEELVELKNGSSLADLDDLLSRIAAKNNRYRDLLMKGSSFRTDINILINGRHCMFLEGLKTKIGPEDIVDVLFPVIGG
jgi:molybdopterin converting factor small subunit